MDIKVLGPVELQIAPEVRVNFRVETQTAKNTQATAAVVLWLLTLQGSLAFPALQPGKQFRACRRSSLLISLLRPAHSTLSSCNCITGWREPGLVSS